MDKKAQEEFSTLKAVGAIILVLIIVIIIGFWLTRIWGSGGNQLNQWEKCSGNNGECRSAESGCSGDFPIRSGAALDCKDDKPMCCIRAVT